jgi:hypothetical protein
MNERRVIAYHPEFCALFNGCVSCAVFLSQLVYWHGKGEDGKPRYNIHDHQGNFWLAKSFKDWHKETGITRDKFLRALEILRYRGIIATAIMRFMGSPTLHVRFLALNGRRETITAEQIMKDHVLLSANHLPTTANANAEACNFTTETTTETTTENEPAVPLAHAKATTATTTKSTPGAVLPTPPTPPFPTGNELASANGVLELAYEEQAVKEAGYPSKNSALVSLWQDTHHGITGKFQVNLTGKEKGQLKKIADLIGPDTSKVIRWALENWETFGYQAKYMHGLGSFPQAPKVAFLLGHADVAYAVYQKRMAKNYIAPEGAPKKKEPMGNMPPDVNPWTGEKATAPK